MSGTAKHDDIEDVLSSIRRLVSDAAPAEPVTNVEPVAQPDPEPSDRLLLTPALRVGGADQPEAPEPVTATRAGAGLDMDGVMDTAEQAWAEDSASERDPSMAHELSSDPTPEAEFHEVEDEPALDDEVDTEAALPPSDLAEPDAADTAPGVLTFPRDHLQAEAEAEAENAEAADGTVAMLREALDDAADATAEAQDTDAPVPLRLAGLTVPASDVHDETDAAEDALAQTPSDETADTAVAETDADATDEDDAADYAFSADVYPHDLSQAEDLSDADDDLGAENTLEETVPLDVAEASIQTDDASDSADPGDAGVEIEETQPSMDVDAAFVDNTEPDGDDDPQHEALDQISQSDDSDSDDSAVTVSGEGMLGLDIAKLTPLIAPSEPAFEPEDGDTDWPDTDSVQPALDIAAVRQARGEGRDDSTADAGAETTTVPVFARSYRRPMTPPPVVEEADDTSDLSAAISRAMGLRRDAEEVEAEVEAELEVSTEAAEAEQEVAEPDDEAMVSSLDPADADPAFEPTDDPADASLSEPEEAGMTALDPAPEADDTSADDASGQDAMADLPAAPEAETAEDADDDDAGLMLDEDALREMIAQVIREELQGELGQRITRNVRKMVRREIRLAMSSEDFD